MWLDGPSSEFKNEYMAHLQQRLSARYKINLSGSSLQRRMER